MPAYGGLYTRRYFDEVNKPSLEFKTRFAYQPTIPSFATLTDLPLTQHYVTSLSLNRFESKGQISYI